MRQLDRIQSHLEAIYDLSVGEQASDFLIDRGSLELLIERGLLAPELAATDEQVLLMPDSEGFSIGVYLSEEVRAGLEGPRTLQVHCHATEAVSHFLMLLWTAREGRQVRLLDLELQAEIDKAATALLGDLQHSGGTGVERLLHQLFDGANLLSHLDEESRQRYREAHRLARAYSHQLAALLDEGADRLLAELRRLYRLPAEGKLQHIARAA